MKNFVQPSNTITLTAPYAVASGDGLLVGSIFGVAAGAAALGESVHQNAPFNRTRPMVSPAPPATASVATPISVFEVATVVVRLLVSSQ